MYPAILLAANSRRSSNLPQAAARLALTTVIAEQTEV
jgi:hypothetical protein